MSPRLALGTPENVAVTQVRAELDGIEEEDGDNEVEEEASSDEDVEPSLPDSGTFTSLLRSMGIGQDEENGEKIHLQQVLNTLVNG